MKKNSLPKKPGGSAVIRFPDGKLTVVLIDRHDVNKYLYFGGPQWAYGDYEVVQYVPSTSVKPSSRLRKLVMIFSNIFRVICSKATTAST